MTNKKQKEKKTEAQAPKSVPTLTYEEYYQTLMLAKKIRLENIKAIKKAKNPKEKVQLLENLFINYQVSRTNPKEKEYAILLKTNIFIPDSEQFLIDYKTKYDKNIRLISEAYQIPAPFAISKVSEIGKYNKYLERLEKEGGLGEVEISEATIPNNESLTISDDLEPLYDDSSTNSLEKQPKERNLGQSEIVGSASPKVEITTAPVQPKNVETETSVSPSIDPLSGVVSEELLRHINAMQRYCTRLLDNNEQLSTENDGLTRFSKELQSLIARLKQENASLKTQNETLVAQVTVLTEKNASLQSQLSEVETPLTARTITEETESERKLRQQIKDIEFTNQELVDQLAEEKEKTSHYRNRAIVAEAQLEQLQDGMQGIFKEVDELDMVFFNDNKPKQK